MMNLVPKTVLKGKGFRPNYFSNLSELFSHKEPTSNLSRNRSLFPLGLATLLIIISINLISCNQIERNILIRDIPQKKLGRVTQVTGRVKATVPLLQGGAYQLQDNTGSIWVITSTSLPVNGTKITVKGKIQQKNLPIFDEIANELYLMELQQLPLE